MMSGAQNLLDVVVVAAVVVVVKQMNLISVIKLFCFFINRRKPII